MSIILTTITACSGGGTGTPSGEGVSPEQKAAIEKIVKYAEHGTPVPTVKDYSDAGVIGINVFNLDEVNALIEGLEAEDIDSSEELQALVDRLGVTLPNRVPVAEDQNITVDEDTNSTLITLSGSDPDGNALTYSIVTTPEHGTLRGTASNVAYTPDADYAGRDSFTFSVNDGKAVSAPATVNIMVRDIPEIEVPEVNHAPTISGIPDVTVVEDSPYSFTPSAEDADSGDTLTFSISNRPPWAVFNTATGALTGTPANENVGTAGGITITVRDSSGAKSSLESFDLEVINSNDAPTISGIPDVTVVEDSPYSFTPSAEDADSGDTLTFSISNRPPWAVFNTATGALTGMPADNSDVGVTNNITIEVKDSAGKTASLVPFAIEVTNIIDSAPLLVESEKIERFTYSGDANWTEDNTTYYTESGAWVNEDIEDNQTACMETKIEANEEMYASFYYKISSEIKFDFLLFNIDDAQERQSGEIKWTPSRSYMIAEGNHTLKWCYRKDSSNSRGADTVWIDEILLGKEVMHYVLPEDTMPGQIGTIGIVVQEDAAIDHFTLSGEGSEMFEVAADGTLFLKSKLDYETKRDYTLSIKAHNSRGESNSVVRSILVKDVDDLYIESAFYDDNNTEKREDDTLILHYTKAIDSGSILPVVSENFLIHSKGSIDAAGTGDYNESLHYSHLLTLGTDTALLPLDGRNISIAPDTITDLSGAVTDSTQTCIRHTTGSATVKKTGQRESYNGCGDKAYPICSSRDDGYYQSGVTPHYSRDDTKEVVTDHLTGLMWADDANVSSVKRQWLTNENYDICSKNTDDPACHDTNGTTAETYCEDLILGEYADWRLPTREELVKLSDYSRYNPAIDSVFENSVSDLYWVSTSYVDNHQKAWSINFKEGKQGYNSKDIESYVRCVRE